MKKDLLIVAVTRDIVILTIVAIVALVMIKPINIWMSGAIHFPHLCEMKSITVMAVPPDFICMPGMGLCGAGYVAPPPSTINEKVCIWQTNTPYF